MGGANFWYDASNSSKQIVLIGYLGCNGARNQPICGKLDNSRQTT
jgi:hypothetical protein